MRRMKMVLAGCVALAGLTGHAAADELDALKAEIEALNARIAAMEQAPAVPQGFRLLSIYEGALEETPGAPLGARERAAYAGRATYIAVMPTADAPSGATISWSGYVRADLVYNGVDIETHARAYSLTGGDWVRDPAKDEKSSSNTPDTDVGGRSQLLLQANTKTDVGKIGVEIEMRGDMDGNGSSDIYAKVAWGYWEMTPELTLAGGYNQSLGDIVYGYDGSCTCYVTDNADVDFNPGDTTQLRLSYAEGKFGANVALEGAALNNGTISEGLLGVAGDITYSGDLFSGEIAGVWRDSNKSQTGSSQIWQVGLGGSIELGDAGSFTFAAATGEGPYTVVTSGTIINGLAYNNLWWGASAFTSLNLGDKAHIELAAGYKHREGDQSVYKGYDVSDVNYHTYAVMGGLYYTPVSQLTLGIEGEWYTVSLDGDAIKDNIRYDITADSDTLWADFVAVWSF